MAVRTVSFFFEFLMPPPCLGLGLTTTICQVDADVDQSIRDNPQPHPTLHPRRPLIETAVQTMAAFEHTDATLPSRAPLLSLNQR